MWCDEVFIMNLKMSMNVFEIGRLLLDKWLLMQGFFNQYLYLLVLVEKYNIHSFI